MKKDKLDQPVWYPEWGTLLQHEAFSPAQREQYRQAVVCYLRYCKQMGQRATVASARQFVEQWNREENPSASELATTKSALNWFFQTARRHKPLLRGVPPLAQKDSGKTDWERRLNRRVRTLHYQWRTEQTYRGWSWRFAKFLKDKPVESATGDDVRAFLSGLATEYRLSVLSQNRALNALVFLLREVFAKELGDFSNFTRAHKRLHIPVVLTREECQRLFAALDGTMRLMAELMHSSGLRLTELLGLRVKDVDLASTASS